jgi:hypothetical protein
VFWIFWLSHFRQIPAETVHNFILSVNSQSEHGRYSSRIMALISWLETTWQ